VLWLPVAAGILALLFVTLFVRGFYWDLPSVGLLLVGLLAVLVAVKGLSMIWTISETETIKETLRSSMYLATFLLALAALSSGRQVGPLIDVSVVMVAAVAGYGLLQKINPIEYPVRSLDGVRVDSTLQYSNTTAVILGMGMVLALARMGTVRNFVLRAFYAALTLSFLIALYLTVSRGGIGSLGIGLVVLFVFGSGRLRMFADLLLLSLPGAWLWWQMQSLPGLLGTGILRQQKIDDGITFRNDLILALLVAFALQAAFAFVANRYEMAASARRWLGIIVVAGGVLAAVSGVLVVVDVYGGPTQAYAALVGNQDETGNVGQRLVSFDISSRGDYWRVAWQAWKERPFTGTRGWRTDRGSRGSNRYTTCTSNRAPRPACSPSWPSSALWRSSSATRGGPPGGRTRRGNAGSFSPGSSPRSSSTSSPRRSSGIGTYRPRHYSSLSLPPSPRSSPPGTTGVRPRHPRPTPPRPTDRPCKPVECGQEDRRDDGRPSLAAARRALRRPRKRGPQEFSLSRG
jgi:hypothetical protein